MHSLDYQQPDPAHTPNKHQPPPPPHPFYGTFSGTTRVSRCQKRTSGLMEQGKINRGRQTDHPAGRYSSRTNQCPPPPSPIFLQAGCPSCRPTNSAKALKATSAFGLGKDARVLLNGITCTVSVPYKQTPPATDIHVRLTVRCKMAKIFQPSTTA